MPDSRGRLILTIGGFDGVHLGHQAIIRAVQEEAQSRNALSGLVTFEPHPAQLLHPEFPYLLTPLEEKKLVLAELGVDYVHVIGFNQRLRNLAPEEFVLEEIVKPLKPVGVVIGADHRFGQNARGDVRLLEQILAQYSIPLKIIPEVVHLGAPVRSTRIREHLVLGHIRLANELLGRRYGILGRVVHGTGTGRKLGFPTVNVEPVSADKLLPAEGVYAGYAEFGGRNFLGAVNIGFKPTFGGTRRVVEVHLLDFQGEVAAGTAVTVRLSERIRPEQKFPDVSALRTQIAADIVKIRQVLERER
ncbi:MAG: bifunctional riboflavin kinase/FAD synthetase [candidate division WOR-3 bacterium]|uniref:Riboflavin biosynthesis protein n=1 Tax=candidate division WOR-3 bacterium TaxID=2052148 RepID=A0A7C1WXW3_UNCW3|nr:bifunctional riboflavin kinase/FAD synthetase [candidate division WOR-3 bacterium]